MITKDSFEVVDDARLRRMSSIDMAVKGESRTRASCKGVTDQGGRGSHDGDIATG